MAMQEEWAIQQVLNVYSQSCSRADWDQVIAQYLPDGIWDIPRVAARFEGHRRIREGLVHFSSSMDYIVQINSPAVITIEGGLATSHCLIRECGKYAGRDEALEVLGAYDDQLQRTAQGWKFMKRICHVYGMHNFPLSRGDQPRSAV